MEGEAVGPLPSISAVDGAGLIFGEWGWHSSNAGGTLWSKVIELPLESEDVSRVLRFFGSARVAQLFRSMRLLHVSPINRL